MLLVIKSCKRSAFKNSGDPNQAHPVGGPFACTSGIVGSVPRGTVLACI